jgi:adenylate cyclase
MHCQDAAAAAGWKQGYYEMMRARIAGLINDPPAGWTGVHVSK